MMRPRVGAIAVAALAALLSCSLVQADDAALRVMGGAVAPMDEHPAISMDRCIINADVYADESLVRCKFVFRNHGPATAALMGFPARGAYGDSGRPGYSPHLEDLRTWVDGEEADVDLRPGVQEDGGQPATSWYTKRVRFAAGHTRVVRVEYTQPNGQDSGGGRWFRYAVTTGGSWRGPIGALQVTLRWMEQWSWDPQQHSFARWRFRLSEDGRRASWMGTDVDPRHDISFAFFPGWRAHLADNAWLVRPYESGDFDVSLFHLSDILRADKRWDAETRSAQLVLDDLTVLAFSEGAQSVRVEEPWGEGAVSAVVLALPRPTYHVGDRLWTPAANLLRYLGYRTTTDRVAHRIDISRAR